MAPLAGYGSVRRIWLRSPDMALLAVYGSVSRLVSQLQFPPVHVDVVFINGARVRSFGSVDYIDPPEWLERARDR